MSEKRRLPLTRVDTKGSKVYGHESPSPGPIKLASKPSVFEGKGNEKHQKTSAKTYRFQLNLTESTDDLYSAFNFNDLLRDAQEKDPEFEEEQETETGHGALDASGAELVQKLQPRYGSSQRTQAAHEYQDKSVGYDAEDSFIDDSEDFDELIPSCLDTALGGFYVNSGELDFVSIPDRGPNIPRIKGSMAVKPRVELVSKKRKEIEGGSDLKAIKAGKRLASPSSLPSTCERNEVIIDSSICQPIKETEDDIEVIFVNISSAEDMASGMALEEESGRQPEAVSSSSTAYKPGPAAHLPPNLPHDLAKAVNNLKAVLSTKSVSGEECLAFDQESSDALLQVCLKCNEHLDETEKTRVFAHLGRHLRCTKKRLLIEAQLAYENRLREVLAELREEVALIINQEQGEGDGHREKCFVWTERSMSCLREATLIKLSLAKGISEGGFDVTWHSVANFFETEVKHIWPSNRMSTRSLLTVSKSLVQQPRG